MNNISIKTILCQNFKKKKAKNRKSSYTILTKERKYKKSRRRP